MSAAYLAHHGIKGQEWGVKRGPPYPLNSQQKRNSLGMEWRVIRKTPKNYGALNLEKAKTANLDKWGKTPNTNVLYIGGYSGSGKSTTAESMADKNTDKIHLDVYFDDVSSGAGERSKAFDKYLKDRNIKPPNQVPMKRWRKEKTLDKFEKAVSDFGKEQYKNGRKVIAEGIQILDGGLNNQSFYKNQPIILLNTSAVSSLYRRLTRDNDKIYSLKNAKDYFEWYTQTNRQINELASTINAKKGEQWVKDYLEQFR